MRNFKVFSYFLCNSLEMVLRREEVELQKFYVLYEKTLITEVILIVQFAGRLINFACFDVTYFYLWLVISEALMT